MMQKQTKDFIIGYVFSNIENKVTPLLSTANINSIEIEGKVQVPKIWFGLSCSKDLDNTIYDCTSYTCPIVKTLYDLYSKVLTYFSVNLYPQEQYMIFDFKVMKEEPKKKMTLKQIEKELGYKIELISERECACCYGR